MSAKLLVIPALLLCLLATSARVLAQSKTKASVAFAYLPEKGEDQYNQRITQKTIPLSQNEFVILSRQATDGYMVERYNASLKKVWQTPVPLAATETAEAFFTSPEAAYVITRRLTGDTQRLYGHRIHLQTGQKQDEVILLEAPAKGRRAGVAYAADGTYLLAYRYHTDNSQQIKDISSSLFDGKLNNVKDTKYNLSDVAGILTADIKVSNTGEQYVGLISDNMNRLTVRQYPLGSPKAKVMSVLVGGVYSGKKVYIIDSKFELMPNNILYGAVLTAEESTGMYYSLKAVKFDFAAEDMIFAEEFRFTPAYIEQASALGKNAGTTRLEDIYLSDLLLTPEQEFVVIAEKKYTEGGENAPYFAKELHLFAYDEYMSKDWNSVLMKHQQAPADEAFTGISYKPNVTGNTLNLLTLEELQGKYDVYLRQINTKTGEASAPKATRLNVASNKSIAYVKDFTAWLSDRNIIMVVRPNKKSSELQLSHIQLK